MLRKIMLLAAIVAVVLSSAATTLASSRSANNSAKGNSGNHKDIAGLVDIGGGRKMYLECHGKGSPPPPRCRSRPLHRTEPQICMPC